jgi:hypothetical protein
MFMDVTDERTRTGIIDFGPSLHPAVPLLGIPGTPTGLSKDLVRSVQSILRHNGWRVGDRPHFNSWLPFGKHPRHDGRLPSGSRQEEPDLAA